MQTDFSDLYLLQAHVEIASSAVRVVYFYMHSLPLDIARHTTSTVWHIT